MIFQLILKNIQNNKFISFISIIVIFLVIFFSSILNFIYSNIQNILLNETIWQDEKKFIIEVKKINLINSLSSKANLQQNYENLKKDKNIEKVYWIYQVNIPVETILNIWKFDFKTDLIVFASDKYTQNLENLEIWISPIVLNIYNTQIANNQLPILNEYILSQLKIFLIFWKNSFLKYDKTIEKTWYIKNIDSDLPIFWITIPYNQVEKIQKEIWWNIKLIKIIWYTKNTSYLHILEEKYKNQLNIQSLNESKIKINQQTKIIKYIFNIIKWIIYILMISFLILLTLHILNKNEKNIKVLYYHGASFLQRFNVVFFEMLIYFIIAIIINIFIISFFNKNFINIVNQKIISYWIYNINIHWISFLNILLNSFISFIIISIVFFIVFIKKRN